MFFCIILAPPLIDCIKIFGVEFTILLKFHITPRIEKGQNIVGISNSGKGIVHGSLDDGEVIVIGD